MQICLCHVNVAIDLPGLPQIPAPAADQSCAATSSANALIGIGCPHAPPSCANLHSARRSRRHRMPFPAGSFLGGFRTPATVQAASLPSAGIRNPQHFRTFLQTLNCRSAVGANRCFAACNVGDERSLNARGAGAWLETRTNTDQEIGRAHV